jgi:hypothetical protein
MTAGVIELLGVLVQLIGRAHLPYFKAAAVEMRAAGSATVVVYHVFH